MEKMTNTLMAALMAALVFFCLGFSERGIRFRSQRVALVIGNGHYESSPLRNPANDAHDMAGMLRHLGFKVVHKANIGQREMENVIREFGRRLHRESVGLFYFSGHGIQVNDRNYLIPVGAEIHEETEIKYEGVDVGKILDAMYNAKSTSNIVILDACRDNPFARSFRSPVSGLARMEAPVATIIAYATAPGKVASDGNGRNGVYTKHLLRQMTIPGLTIEQVFKRTRNAVMEETGSKQITWESTSLTDDFYFVTSPQATSHDILTTTPEKERTQTKTEEQLSVFSTLPPYERLAAIKKVFSEDFDKYKRLKGQSHAKRRMIHLIEDIVDELEEMERVYKQLSQTAETEEGIRTTKDALRTMKQELFVLSP